MVICMELDEFSESWRALDEFSESWRARVNYQNRGVRV